MAKEKDPGKREISPAEIMGRNRAQMAPDLIAVQQRSSGPLPAPEVLEKYGRIQADLVERIVRMAEEEGSARRANDRAIVDAQVHVLRSYTAEVKRGQGFAFVLTLLCLALGGVAIWRGHDAAGATVATGGLGTIITAFIYGRARKDVGVPETAAQKSRVMAKADSGG